MSTPERGSEGIRTTAWRAAGEQASIIGNAHEPTFIARASASWRCETAARLRTVQAAEPLEVTWHAAAQVGWLGTPLRGRYDRIAVPAGDTCERSENGSGA